MAYSIQTVENKIDAGELDEAREMLEYLLQINPGSEAIWVNYARCVPPGARVGVLKAGLQHLPNSMRLLAELAQHDRESQTFEREQAMEARRSDLADTKPRRVVKYLGAATWGAVSTMDDTKPSSSKLIIHAQASIKQGDMKTAQAILQQVMKYDPANEDAWLFYVDTLPDDDLEGRIEVLQDYLAINLNSVNAISRLNAYREILDRQQQTGTVEKVPVVIEAQDHEEDAEDFLSMLVMMEDAGGDYVWGDVTEKQKVTRDEVPSPAGAQHDQEPPPITADVDVAAMMSAMKEAREREETIEDTAPGDLKAQEELAELLASMEDTDEQIAFPAAETGFEWDDTIESKPDYSDLLPSDTEPDETEAEFDWQEVSEPEPDYSDLLASDDEAAETDEGFDWHEVAEPEPDFTGLAATFVDAEEPAEQAPEPEPEIPAEDDSGPGAAFAEMMASIEEVDAEPPAEPAPPAEDDSGSGAAFAEMMASMEEADAEPPAELAPEPEPELPAEDDSGSGATFAEMMASMEEADAEPPTEAAPEPEPETPAEDDSGSGAAFAEMMASIEEADVEPPAEPAPEPAPPAEDDSGSGEAFAEMMASIEEAEADPPTEPAPALAVPPQEEERTDTAFDDLLATMPETDAEPPAGSSPRPLFAPGEDDGGDTDFAALMASLSEADDLVASAGDQNAAMLRRSEGEPLQEGLSFAELMGSFAEADEKPKKDETLPPDVLAPDDGLDEEAADLVARMYAQQDETPAESGWPADETLPPDVRMERPAPQASPAEEPAQAVPDIGLAETEALPPEDAPDAAFDELSPGEQTLPPDFTWPEDELDEDALKKFASDYLGDGEGSSDTAPVDV